MDVSCRLLCEYSLGGRQLKESWRIVNISRDLNQHPALASVRRVHGFAILLFFTCVETISLTVITLSEHLWGRDHALLALVSISTAFSLCSSVCLAVIFMRTPSDQDVDRSVTTQGSESFSRMRRKLQRDLHDGFGPTITAANMHIETARRLLEDNPDRAAELLSKAHTEIDFAVSHMRRLIRHLHVSTEVPAQGLGQAIKELGEQFQQATGGRLKVIVTCPPLDPRATSEVYEELYFIAQEAITNVVRHANATLCMVKLSTNESGITLTVRDDGIGLREPHVYGIGLKSMQERAAERGGTFTILTHLACGIQVEAFLPWKREGGATGNREESLYR
jgi:signal transduction histidine kinase